MARGKTITLKYDGKCRDCGAALAAGERARWYGRGKVYGIGCHERGSAGGGGRSRGGGRVLVSSRCEDFPCCGHGPPPMGDDGGCPRVYETPDGGQEERFGCASCGVEMGPDAPSAVCDGCHGRARRSADFNWGPLESDPDSFFYEPGG